ncbi:MAG: CDP-diacylglycerol--glycerol-3-phosphate 3-phosphatidyltransferase [Bacteroidetes bacterium]|nr:CDP-diacylglycerol--glycerol-3-phosphate 3-phosphatidyltransferase [Bacteroidota bacterium]
MFRLTPPNQLTLLRIALTPLFVFLFFSESSINRQISLLVYIFAATTDWYDGYVARRWGYITRWGKFLDPLADKILTSAAFISFIYIGYAEAWMVWVIVIRDILITGLRSYAEFTHRTFDTSSFAKTKTFLQMVVIYLFIVVYVVRTTEIQFTDYGKFIDTYASLLLMQGLMLVVTILTALTGILYLQKNFSTIKNLFSGQIRGTESEHN